MLTRVVVVVAHPDDETIGFGVRLAAWRPLVVVLTDGAPRDPWFARQAGFADRQGYARARAGELERALAIAGVPPEQVRCLGAADQCAIDELPRLAAELAPLVAAADLVATHAYEGGHPDHDAAALLVHTLAARAPAPPTIVEAPYYHDAFGETVYGRFMPVAGAGPVDEHALSPTEHATKQAMAACHATQRAVLQRFDLGVERVRVAPRYDFRRPPHPGRLHYERWGWPTTAARFCERVAVLAP